MSDPAYSAILDFWFDGALNNSDAAVARLSACLSNPTISMPRLQTVSATYPKPRVWVA